MDHCDHFRAVEREYFETSLVLSHVGDFGMYNPHVRDGAS